MAEHVEASPRTLSTEELAREAGVTPDHIHRLLQAGAIQANPDGTHEVASIARVRLAMALADGGVDLDDLMEVIHSGAVHLDWVARLWSVAQPSGRTFEEFALTLGDHAVLLPSIYAAFGLAVPPAQTVMRQDEETAIADFIDLWAMVDDQPETFLRAARIAGDGVRRIQGGTQDLFDELGGPPAPQAARGRSPEDAMQPAMRFSPVVAQLLVWLQKRHMENETFGRVVDYVEDVLVRSGHVERREPPAIAFVDLSDYTALTVEAGDERAARFATTLQTLAEAAARAHHGRVIKLLGDGVMLRYPSALDAVRSVQGLMAAIVDADLPAAHAGIAAGPLVLRDGDVYGHTVNLAARIAGQAGAGEVLVAGAVTERLDPAGIGWVDAGEARLKGLAEPVRLARVPTSRS
jgi:adenylate cyclase